MNAERRAALTAVAEKLEGAKEELQSLLTEEQDYLDAMPESFANGERGSQAEEAIRSMEEAIESIDGAVGSVTEATEG